MTVNRVTEADRLPYFQARIESDDETTEKMMKRNNKKWLLAAIISGSLVVAFAAVALQGEISLDSPVTFPVDI